MSFEFWYMFPVAILIAILANSSGFSGGVLFQPIYNLLLNIPLPNAIATGIATETIGMTSGAIRYLYYKMPEMNIGFVMIMLTIPGVVIGNNALMIINENFLKLVLGVILIGIASMQLYYAIRRFFGTRDSVPIEEIYPYMWIPPVSGFFSATTGTGIAEISQPLLEKGLGLKTKKANATAILIEATGDWVITILNFHAGLILWNLWIFTGLGVLIGGQIGPYLSKFLPDRIIKIIFSVAIIIIGIFYLYKGILWIIS